MEDNFSPNGQPSPRGKLNQKTHDLAVVNCALGIDEAAIDAQVLDASFMSAGDATPLRGEINANAPIGSSFFVHQVKSNSLIDQSKPWCRIQTRSARIFRARRKYFRALPAWLQSPSGQVWEHKRRTTGGLSHPGNRNTDGYRRSSARISAAKRTRLCLHKHFRGAPPGNPCRTSKASVRKRARTESNRFVFHSR